MYIIIIAISIIIIHPLVLNLHIHSMITVFSSFGQKTKYLHTSQPKKGSRLKLYFIPVFLIARVTIV